MSLQIKVKPLVWDEHNRADIYSVKEYFGQGPTDYFLSRGTRIVGNFNTVTEAKAAAQADHERRVREAIDETAGSIVAAEREACALIADQYDQGPGDDSPVGPVFAAQVGLAQSIAGQIRARSTAL